MAGIHAWGPLNAQAKRWRNQYLDHFEHARSLRRTPPLTGRAWLCVNPMHTSASLNVEGGMATLALCHEPARKAAVPGDVIFAVSRARQLSWGIDTTERLLLSVFVVSDSMLPAAYHGVGAEAWAHDRVDRIYKAVVLGSNPRDRHAAVVEMDNGRSRSLKSFRQLGRRAAWRAEYSNGAIIEYALRRRVRWHGPRLPVQERKRDFRGRVLAGSAFMVLPGNAEHAKSIRTELSS